jgi:hypothetical protein
VRMSALAHQVGMSALAHQTIEGALISSMHSRRAEEVP